MSHRIHVAITLSVLGMTAIACSAASDNVGAAGGSGDLSLQAAATDTSSQSATATSTSTEGSSDAGNDANDAGTPCQQAYPMPSYCSNAQQTAVQKLNCCETLNAQDACQCTVNCGNSPTVSLCNYLCALVAYANSAACVAEFPLPKTGTESETATSTGTDTSM